MRVLVVAAAAAAVSGVAAVAVVATVLAACWSAETPDTPDTYVRTYVRTLIRQADNDLRRFLALREQQKRDSEQDLANICLGGGGTGQQVFSR